MTTRLERFAPAAVGALILFALLVVGGLLYSSGGGSSRDSLVTELLINTILVVGIQIYIGNTGILSFGHVGFAGVAAYVFALTAIDPEDKARVIPDAPFGVTDLHLSVPMAMVAAVVVTVGVALIVGFGLTRSGAQSGAVAATVITLGLLFVVNEVVSNWPELTGGSRSGLSFGIGDNLRTRGAIYLTLAITLLVARLFRETDRGRMAQAAREDDLAARAMGLNPAVQQMLALLLSVAVVAVAASFKVYVLGSVSPRFFFFDLTLLTLTMLIVGGRNSVTGAVLGVVVITIGNESTRWLSGPDADLGPVDFLFREGLTKIFLGGAMLGFMIYRAHGLLDDRELDHLLRGRLRRRPATDDSATAPSDDATASEDADRDAVVLRAEGVSVEFGGFQALSEAHLEARSDEIVGLIGPNGAGKTTLLNVLTGIVEPTSGVVALGEVRLDGLPTRAIARHGLVRTFQNLRLFPALTVTENVAVAALSATHHRPDRAPVAVEDLLAACGLSEIADRRASALDYGNARRLELARAAAVRPRFLLLDEPTSGMSDAESLAMIDRVRRVAALVDAGVVVIDHDLGFITGICDRIVCLDQGRVIAEGSPEEIQADARVRAAYLGEAVPSEAA